MYTYKKEEYRPNGIISTKALELMTGDKVDLVEMIAVIQEKDKRKTNTRNL